MGSKNNPGRFDCYSNALSDEPMFILLARDPNAPALVNAWASRCEQEIGAGNRPESDRPMVTEARQCAENMRAWRTANDGNWRNPSPPPPAGDTVLVPRAALRVVVDDLDEVIGAIDHQTYEDQRAAEFDRPDDAESNVNITARQERSLENAWKILNRALAAAPLPAQEVTDAITGTADDFLPGSADDWRKGLESLLDNGKIEALVDQAVEAFHSLLFRLDAYVAGERNSSWRITHLQYGFVMSQRAGEKFDDFMERARMRAALEAIRRGT